NANARLSTKLSRVHVRENVQSPDSRGSGNPVFPCQVDSRFRENDAPTRNVGTQLDSQVAKTTASIQSWNLGKDY
ncbi:MAG: hypothetical protein L0312_21745, partial [Acidobacteria bacterium]|nr:hypothetical protein [Acidobacteriota bacterium]